MPGSKNNLSALQGFITLALDKEKGGYWNVMIQVTVSNT